MYEDFLIQRTISADIYLFKVNNRKPEQFLTHVNLLQLRQLLKTCLKQELKIVCILKIVRPKHTSSKKSLPN